MLNGFAPVFIFTVSPIPKASNPLSNIPIINDILENAGIPIPIYLDEKVTGLYVESEEKSIDIDNDVIAAIAKSGSKVIQNPLESMVTINLFGKRDSIALTVLLAMNDLIFSKLKYGYGISYLNGPTAIFNGLLKTFSTHASNNDDLIRITVQISKAKGNNTIGALNALPDTATVGVTQATKTITGSNILVPPDSPAATILPGPK